MIPVTSAIEMLQACERELPSDIAVFTAAVADWRVAQEASQKLKKGTAGVPTLEFVENPDILMTISKASRKRPKLVVGFAAETENLLTNAREKLNGKGCDLIIANDVAPARGVFGGNDNTVHLVSAAGDETWERMSKQGVATRLMDKLATMLLAQT
jgi:phosphopantothenoylcysteine decarboxylase/phosphopantothenate--cysteine ligase